MTRARRVNPVIFSKDLCIGKSKALPSKKHKSSYHLALEEAAGDLILNNDASYLQSIIEDLKKSNVMINKFRTLEVDCCIASTTIKSCLYVDQNVVTVKITVPYYSLKFKVTPEEIISQGRYDKCISINPKIMEKIKGVHQSLRKIYGSDQIC